MQRPPLVDKTVKMSTDGVRHPQKTKIKKCPREVSDTPVDITLVY